MKKLFSFLGLWLLLSVTGYGQSGGPITVTDGTRTCNNCRTIVFSSITVSGNKATVVGGGGGGSGDVVGPASATDNAIVRFDSTTGKLIQNSVVTIADTTGNMTGVGTLNTHTIPGGTSTFTLQSDNLSVFASTTSAQLRGILSDESGTGVAYFQGGNLGTPSGGVGTNFTGIPVSTGLTGAGTGVLTALGVNVGSAGAFVIFNGAGGTPSSLTLTNATGLPPTTGISGWPANASGVLTNNGSGTLSWSAAGGGLTVGTTTIASGTATRLLYETSGNVLGEISGATSNGTAVTFSSGNLIATSPQVTTGINDSNGNELFLLTATGSAVNEFTIANAATGNRPSITASGGDTNIGITLAAKGTGSIVVNDGTATNPSIVFASSTGHGLYRLGTQSMGVSVAGTVRAAFLNTELSLGTQFLTFGSAVASADVTLRRSAAANLAFGAADAASPVAQTLSVQNVVAGTSNTAGVDWTFKGSAGTGTGAGGGILFSTAPAGSTGTTQNSFAEAFRINNYGGGRPKSVTFANLPGSPTNGDFIYCSDCAPTSAFVDQTCASGGSGSMAFRVNGAWKCYN